MYAVSFDLVVAETKKHHPKGDPSAAYADIYKILVTTHGFEWKQGSLYVLDDEDMARLFAAIMDLKKRRNPGSRTASGTSGRSASSSGPTSRRS